MTTPNHTNISRIGNQTKWNTSGTGRGARVAIVLADDRPIALIFPTSRRLVLERLRKLLDADEVRLADPDEVEQIHGRSETGPIPTHPDLRGVSSLVDATLMSARTLHVRCLRQEVVVPLNLEDWLVSAGSGWGFFTEPDSASCDTEPNCSGSPT